ncbi:MAG TPA: hypothetical protein VFI20_02510 [Terracidiphilus sp.]|nr:hypothetical protein [Terracidiphilus sp.]
MKPETIGRVLGAGMRVAGRMAGERLSGGSQQPASGGQPATRAAGKAAGRATKGLGRAVGGFLRPFARVGRVVMLEVAGVFFLLFVFVFARTMWYTRASYAHGPDHWKFLIAAGLLVLFVYLGVTSFLRARRK